MRDKRPVDELSIEELERILAIRKREARMARLRTYEGNGRRVEILARTGRVLPRLPISDDTESSKDAAPSEQIAPEYAPVPTWEMPNEEPPKTSLPPRPAAPVRTEYYDGAPQFEDELDAHYMLHATRQPGSRARAVLWNRALTLVEIAAVIGLIVLIVGLFQSFQEITQTTASIQAEYEATQRAQYIAPTATPVINIAAVVLPSGHIYSASQPTFNLEEIPAQYREQYVSYVAQIPVSRPTPSPEGPIRVRIPRIGVDSAVVAGDDFEALKLGVGHHIGSANPGQQGNMVLSGHNDIFGEVFRHLNRLEPGDEIIVSTRTKDYTYVVQAQQEKGQTKGHILVQPDAVWVLGSSGDAHKLTLISCYPYRVSNKRIIVFATLKR